MIGLHKLSRLGRFKLVTGFRVVIGLSLLLHGVFGAEY